MTHRIQHMNSLHFIFDQRWVVAYYISRIYWLMGLGGRHLGCCGIPSHAMQFGCDSSCVDDNEPCVVVS